jgi:hypothetical protein
MKMIYFIAEERKFPFVTKKRFPYWPLVSRIARPNNSCRRKIPEMVKACHTWQRLGKAIA